MSRQPGQNQRAPAARASAAFSPAVRQGASYTLPCRAQNQHLQAALRSCSCCTPGIAAGAGTGSASTCATPPRPAPPSPMRSQRQLPHHTPRLGPPTWPRRPKQWAHCTKVVWSTASFWRHEWQERQPRAQGCACTSVHLTRSCCGNSRAGGSWKRRRAWSREYSSLRGQGQGEAGGASLGGEPCCRSSEACILRLSSRGRPADSRSDHSQSPAALLALRALQRRQLGPHAPPRRDGRRDARVHAVSVGEGCAAGELRGRIVIVRPQPLWGTAGPLKSTPAGQPAPSPDCSLRLGAALPDGAVRLGCGAGPVEGSAATAAPPLGWGCAPAPGPPAAGLCLPPASALRSARPATACRKSSRDLSIAPWLLHFSC